MNRCLTRLEYYFGQDYTIEELPIPSEFVSDFQEDLRKAHDQVFTRLSVMRDRMKVERNKIEGRMREYHTKKAAVCQNRICAERCAEEIDRRMQE